MKEIEKKYFENIGINIDKISVIIDIFFPNIFPWRGQKLCTKIIVCTAKSLGCSFNYNRCRKRRDTDYYTCKVCRIYSR